MEILSECFTYPDQMKENNKDYEYINVRGTGKKELIVLIKKNMARMRYLSK